MESRKFEKIHKVRLPFDRRSDDPKTNYGIGNLWIYFILKGPAGAVQFAFYINDTYLPHVEAELDSQERFPDPVRGDLGRYVGVDVGYHSPRPMYDGQAPMQKDCELIEGGGQCYYDGSGLRAADWVKEIFSVSGRNPEDLIWEKLEAEYVSLFESSDEDGD